MKIWSLGAFTQWFESLWILDIVCFYAYPVHPGSVTILLIKLYDLIIILWHLDYVILFYVMPLSMGSRDIVNTDENFSIIGEAPWPLPIGCVEYPIVSHIGKNGDLVIFLDIMHRLLCLFYSIPNKLGLIISICSFLWPMILPRFQILDLSSFLNLFLNEIFLVHQLLTVIDILYNGFILLLQKLFYFSTFIGDFVISRKGCNPEGTMDWQMGDNLTEWCLDHW